MHLVMLRSNLPSNHESADPPHLDCLNPTNSKSSQKLGPNMNLLLYSQGPHSHILMTGGGVKVIFWGLKFWLKVFFFGSMRDAGFFWVTKN